MGFISLAICLLLLFAAIPIKSANAQHPEDLIAKKITRLMHPAYRAGHLYFGVRHQAAWNRDHTRMMLLEEWAYTHPTYGTQGRGLVWGFIDQLKNWTTLEEYQIAAKVVPGWGAGLKSPKGAYWSPIHGEENIIYAPFYSAGNCTLKKIDVDTGLISDIISLDRPGVDCRNMLGYGWTEDQKFICSFHFEDWSDGGWEIDVQAPSKKFISSRPSTCSDAWKRWPTYGAMGSHGHSDKSPSGELYATAYGSGYRTTKGATDCNTGNFILDLNRRPGATHISWKSSENWYLGSDCGPCDWNDKPEIGDFNIHQIFFDGQNFTYRKLLSTKSADRWKRGNDETLNFKAIPIVTLSRNGRMAVFLSTDGNYSYEDYQKTNVTPWGFEGAFLVEFEEAFDSNDTEQPTVPTDLSAVAISENQITLSWHASQDNIGVAGYRIYRDGTQITTTQNANYSDYGLTPSTTHTYTISAYDAAGNESERSASASAATKSPGEPAYTIIKPTGSTTVDGDLSEYAHADSLTFSPSTGANIVTVKALWDSEALHIGYHVTDIQLEASGTNRDGNVWIDDAVEWFIDTQNNGGDPERPDARYMLPDDYHGIVNILNTQYDSKGTATGSPTSSWNGTWLSAVRLDNDDSAIGYTIEIKIPWTTLGYTNSPTENTIVAMSFAIQDKDGSSHSNGMWPNITSAFENASNWQTVLLAGIDENAKDTEPPSPPKGLRVTNVSN